MQILFYTSDEDGSARLSRFIEVIVSRKNITYIHTPEDLFLRLHHPLGDQAIIVVYVSAQEELAHIAEMQDLLSDFRSIIILPDRDKASMAMAYTLRPRFIGYADDDYLDIVTVVSRLVGRGSGMVCQG